MMNERLRLLIVDDSSLMRQFLCCMLRDDPGINIVGEAANGREALKQVAELHPDVITLDIRMPVMDGLATTEQLMAYYPTPILVLTSSLSSYDIDITFRMLDAGALEVMEKPRLDSPQSYDRVRRELLRRIKLLARVQVVTHLRGRRRAASCLQDRSHTAAQPEATLLRQPSARQPALTRALDFPLVVIGASTGGPRVIRQILQELPASFRGAVLVVQHMAAGFSAGMTDWFATTCALPVHIATEGARLVPGTVLVVPEQHNLLIEHDGHIHLSNQPLLLQRPSIDITMQAAAAVFGKHAIGVLLTGMGRDGAMGMQSIRRANGYTIAQEQTSCAVYGMPQAAIALQAVDIVLPPKDIVATLSNLTCQKA